MSVWQRPIMGMMSVSIREATSEDLPAVLALYSQLEIGEGEALPLPEAEALFQRMRSYPNYRLYVAAVGEEVVGTFALLIMDNLAHKGAPSGVVEDVVVEAGWQRKGLGREMMRFAMARCQEAGCYKLVLSSNRQREAAHRFYASLGFRQHGYSFLVE